MLRYDNPFIIFLQKTFDMLALGFFWVLTVLPVFTFGAANAALYRTVLKVIKKNDGKITEEYFGFFRQNLKSSWPLTAMELGLLALLGLYFFGCTLLERGSLLRRGYLALGLVFSMAFLAVSMYLYPLFSRFTYSDPLQYFRSALYFTVRHFKYTLCLVLCPAVVSLVTLLNPVCLLLYPGLVAYMASRFIEPVFRQYMEKPKEGEAAAWYWA